MYATDDSTIETAEACAVLAPPRQIHGNRHNQFTQHNHAARPATTAGHTGQCTVLHRPQGGSYASPDQNSYYVLPKLKQNFPHANTPACLHRTTQEAALLMFRPWMTAELAVTTRP